MKTTSSIKLILFVVMVLLLSKSTEAQWSTTPMPQPASPGPLVYVTIGASVILIVVLVAGAAKKNKESGNLRHDTEINLCNQSHPSWYPVCSFKTVSDFQDDDLLVSDLQLTDDILQNTNPFSLKNARLLNKNSFSLQYGDIRQDNLD